MSGELVPGAAQGFDAPDLAAALETTSVEQLDELPFGVIGFDAEDVVTVYNRDESSRSGMAADKVLGRNIFTEVAPCTNNYLVAQRFVDEPDLDEQLDYVFTFRMRPTPVRLRLLARRGADTRYLVVRSRA